VGCERSEPREPSIATLYFSRKIQPYAQAQATPPQPSPRITSGAGSTVAGEGVHHGERQVIPTCQAVRRAAANL
jgi:hypothetical protein